MTAPKEKKTRAFKALAAPQRDAVLAALPGTIKQISERTGISIDAVWHHIYHLADKWMVERDGRVWMVYHAWAPDAVGSEVPGRTMWLSEVTFDGRSVSVDPPASDVPTRP